MSYSLQSYEYRLSGTDRATIELNLNESGLCRSKIHWVKKNAAIDIGLFCMPWLLISFTPFNYITISAIKCATTTSCWSN